MEARPVVHPSPELLRDLGSGRFDTATVERVLAHLDGCPPCRQAAGALLGDAVLGRLRAARPVGQTVPEAPGAAETPGPPTATPVMAQPVEVETVPQVAPAVLPELRDHPQYEVVRELGRGGMGVVYLARNKIMDRPEVLKVINKQFLGQAGAAERFLREIRAAAKLSHPNIVTAFSALQVGELFAFAMEYVEGETLAQVVQARGRLPVVNACYYAQQVAQALQHACDKGMVHRDIKPHNLILSRHGKKHVVKVLDFGLAKATREREADAGLTGTGMMLGTPDYLAPEQALDAASADIRADIYSLGCTLYFLLSGGPPFQGRSQFELLQAHQSLSPTPLNRVREDVPAELAAVVTKMMAKDPAKRYQRPAEVAQALAPFVKAVTKPLPLPSVHQGTVRGHNATVARTMEEAAAREGRPGGAKRSRRRPLAVALGVAGLLGAIGLCVGVVCLLNRGAGKGGREQSPQAAGRDEPGRGQPSQRGSSEPPVVKSAGKVPAPQVGSGGGLGADKNAGAVIQAFFKDYPFGCVEGKVVGKPKVLARDDAKAKVQITVAFQTNAEAYAAFAVRLGNSLRGLAKSQGEFSLRGRPSTKEPGQFEAGELGLPPPPPPEKGFTHPEVAARQFGVSVQSAFGHPRSSLMKVLLNSEGVVLALNTKTSQLKDRSEWTYYVLDNSARGPLLALTRRDCEVKLSFLNAAGNTVAVERFSLTPREPELDWRRPSSFAVSLIHSPAVLVQSLEKAGSTDPRQPGSAGFARLASLFLVSPLFFEDFTLHAYRPEVVLTRDVTLSLDELRQVQSIRCEVAFTQGPSPSR
jgi:hypothetical protein